MELFYNDRSTMVKRLLIGAALNLIGNIVKSREQEIQRNCIAV